jgi:hypothetical protein
MTPNERKLAENLLAKGYTHLYRGDGERLYAESDTKVLLLDSTYFENVLSKISIELLLAIEDGLELPPYYTSKTVIYKEKPVIKYRNNISKERLKYWLELLKEGYYSELRKQIEKEIGK